MENKDYKKALSIEKIDKVISGEIPFKFRPFYYYKKSWKKISSDFKTYGLSGFLFYVTSFVAYFFVSGYMAGHYEEKKLGKKYDVDDLFRGFDSLKSIFKFIGVIFCVSFCCVLIPYFTMLIGISIQSEALIKFGLIFLSIGILCEVTFAIMNYFTMGLITFTELGIITAIKKGSAVARKCFGRILLFILITICCEIIGLLCCGVGVLITLPMAYLALYYAFEDVFSLVEEDTNEVKELI